VEAAYQAGHIQPDLIPVALRTDEGYGLATEDEGRRPSTTMEGLAALKTPFRPHGKVTAGNASPLTDGATVAAMASESTAKELGLGIKMTMVSFGFAGVEPEVMGLGPIPSTQKALEKAGLGIEDIGLFELNEAFAVQVLSFLDHYGIADDDPRVNPWGGAIAVGHPLAASGVRLMIQLARQFELNPHVRYGLTAMCVGLGQGGSVIWENPHYQGVK
jgi:acetyl-CoA acyltransferase